MIMSGFVMKGEESGRMEIQAKVVLVGDAGVGKSCFMTKFVDDTFASNHVVTIGVDYKEKTVEKEKLSMKLQLWDTAGEERFRSLSSGVFTSAEGCFLFFDTTDMSTFTNLSKWRSQLQKWNPDLVVVLVGTKLDMDGVRNVPKEETVKLTSSWGVPLYETSSKTGEGIDQAIVFMTDKLAERKGISMSKTEAIKGRKRGFTELLKGMLRKV